jgi:two-component system, OmpR family, alkaline phosphatase synthesis response regulator PhoP
VTAHRILLVEDEPGLVLTLSDRLAREGYRVETAADGEAALRLASGEPFDLVLLDVMLPKMNGFDVCRALRQRGVDTPVIMLTARGQVLDKVVGLKLGADDYLTKPFEAAELLARIEARLRRAPAAAAASPDTYAFGGVQVDFRRAELTRDGTPLELSAREFQLLRYFIAHRGADALPRRAAERGLGLSRHAVDAHGGRARRLAAAEDRAQPAPPAIHPHGPRPGV